MFICLCFPYVYNNLHCFLISRLSSFSLWSIVDWHWRRRFGVLIGFRYIFTLSSQEGYKAGFHFQQYTKFLLSFQNLPFQDIFLLLICRLAPFLVFSSRPSQAQASYKLLIKMHSRFGKQSRAQREQTFTVLSLDNYTDSKSMLHFDGYAQGHARNRELHFTTLY